MEEEKKAYSVEEILEITIKNLYSISVPVELIEQIGMPIRMNIGNLKQCVEAMKKQKDNNHTGGDEE